MSCLMFVVCFGVICDGHVLLAETPNTPKVLHIPNVEISRSMQPTLLLGGAKCLALLIQLFRLSLSLSNLSPPPPRCCFRHMLFLRTASVC